MPDDPYLFDDLAEPLPLPAEPVYTSPIEQATFDIMELVDSYFRASVTVEEYDSVQKKVKGILTEAFDVKKITLLLLAIVLCSSCLTSRTNDRPPRWPDNQEEFTVDFSEPELTIYDIAEAETGCPVRILRGIHFAESSYGKNLKHPNVFDRGDFGLSEKYHAERAAKWGEYNPDCPLQSAIIAGHIIMENIVLLGSEELGICAYRQGVAGVQKNGAELWYYKRVISV